MHLTETASSLVMVKHFGVSLSQAQRVQALLRLGVTEQDVQIAERLMSSTPPGGADNVSAPKEPIMAAARREYGDLMSLRGEKFVHCCYVQTECSVRGDKALETNK